MDTIRIGLIGAGGNTRGRHIPGLRAVAGVQIVYVANRSDCLSEIGLWPGDPARSSGVPRLIAGRGAASGPVPKPSQ